MTATIRVLTFLMLSTSAHAQWADLRVQGSATPGDSLAVGDELTVSATVHNQGPSPAKPSISIGLGSNVPFYFEFLESLNPACADAQMLDYSPPAFVIDWSPATLAPGAQITCAARLRVRFLPADYRAEFFAAAQVSPPLSDPTQQNNLTSIQVGFLRRTRALAIPALDPLACAFLTLVVVLGGLIFPRTFACGGSKA